MDGFKKLNKYQKSAIILAVIIIILVIIRVSVSNPSDSGMASSTGSVATTTGSTGSSMASNCGFTVTSIKPNEQVTFPITVAGTIDNSNKSSTCKWQMFEGQGGFAQLLYNYKSEGWTKIGAPTPIKATNWMSDKTTFTVNFAFMNKGDSLPSGVPMKILFTEENPSGMGNVDIFELPIVIK